MPLTAGLCGQVELVVTEADTATALASGDVEVLATPRLVALCEQATVEAVQGHLESGQTTVGFRIEISHVAPVSVGRSVVASASLEKVEGKRLVFGVSVNDKCGIVAAGRITRVLVDRDSFMEKVR